jgi:hypothetical protein
MPAVAGVDSKARGFGWVIDVGGSTSRKTVYCGVNVIAVLEGWTDEGHVQPFAAPLIIRRTP